MVRKLPDGRLEDAVATIGRLLRLPAPSPTVGSPISFLSAATAAVFMLLCAIPMGILVPAATGEFHPFQPSERPGRLAELIAPTNEHPGTAIAYFTLDMGFVIGFSLVFVGLYALTRVRSPEFAGFALAAGMWTAATDAVENALYWAYAMRAHAGVELASFDTPLLPVLSGLKMVGFFATYLTFALLLPRRDWLERFTFLLMLLPPTLGLMSMGLRDIADLRPVILAAPAAPLILVFARAWVSASERHTATPPAAAS